MLDWIRRRRAALTLMAGVLACLGFTASVAGPAAAAPAAAAPAVQVCAPNADGGLCINRDGGHTGPGTQAISYIYNNGNNTYTWSGLPDYCGHGTVTLTCPSWNNSSINAALDGAPFGVIEDTADGYCVGLNGVEASCGNDLTGSGAGNGVIVVFVGCNQDVGGCGHANILDNYWTRTNGHESWVKVSVPAGQKIIMGAPQPWPLLQVYTTVEGKFTGPPVRVGLGLAA